MTTFIKILIVTFYCSVATLYFEPVGSERILAIAPIAGRSHWNFMEGILRALTEHGHQITVLTPFPSGDRENYTEIDVSKEIRTLLRLDIDQINIELTSHFDLINFINDYSRNCCKTLYENDFIKNILTDSRSDFDAIFIELMASECISYLSVKLDIPLIYVTPPPLISYLERSVLGHYPNPAVVSHVLANHSIPRTMFERFTNTVLFFYTLFLLQYKSWTARIASKESFDQIEPIKPSIIFSNAHFITDAPRPIPPSVIQVGGIHLSPPKKIPDDILEFIENSPHGVIYFTLGSVVAVSSLPENIRNDIIQVLSQVPQRVLLKYEDEMVDKPENIMVKKWFPQRDILVHPNVKLFISHGGISGVYEAVDAGVPVLGFPLFFDQSRNLRNLVDAGMAISMNLDSVTKDTFMKAILELVKNKKYIQNAKIASDRFKDRPLTPSKAVDYWTRYVIRHKGAPHLKSQALNLKWYQYFLLDVIAVVILVILLFYYAIYKTFIFIKKITFASWTKSKSKSE
ncbi:UDP-glucuronosyltransferase 2B2-like [Rhopalosiphum maidis]|uniref:UDP-glucuronosyltransferase 2B2-like n=1 Tax=Rhopalosiphum maidis TaxID=43146 RepID=UPI000F00A869|nr:UDP-glucuronosyltransferase 2B2-like [Rhopalosiphum maidis]XP_026816850.1 UDP-glucuronosyltransferase 2B2-like [Rhopalosiphum maidis]